MQRIQMVGRRFGRLVVTEQVESNHQPNGDVVFRWRVRCDCGNVFIALGLNLRGGRTKSCGCLRKEIIAVLKQTHGESKKGKWTAEYRIYASMLTRCENPNSRAFKWYGGRGIKVCDRWRESYETFLADMGRRPSKELTLDRIDNDGNYEPSNCRWATRKQQSQNRRPSHLWERRVQHASL